MAGGRTFVTEQAGEYAVTYTRRPRMLVIRAGSMAEAASLAVDREGRGWGRVSALWYLPPMSGREIGGGR